MIKYLLFIFLICKITFSFSASTYLSSPSTLINVNEFGNCHKISNSSNNSFIIPTGIAADWTAFLNHLPTGVSASTCAVDCVGSWGICFGGIQSYSITTPASSGGLACPFSSGATQACGVNCNGFWSTCSLGMQTYTVVSPESSGGLACPYTNGATQSCGTNCFGSWSSCSNGNMTYSIIIPASGGGLACPTANGATQTCGTSCVGSWGNCSQSCGTGTQTYGISLPATGGGANCPFANGTTQSCNTEACITRSYGGCFIAGTKVTMSDGSLKNIETVEVGELIQSYNEKTKQNIITPVIEIFHHEEKINELYTFTLSNGKKVTPNNIHPLFLATQNKYLPAWKIYEMWAAGNEIQLLDENNKIIFVKNILKYIKKTKVYNLHVLSPEDLNFYTLSKIGHNYFANGVLVHNAKCVTDIDICEGDAGENCCYDIGGSVSTHVVGGYGIVYTCKTVISNATALDSCYDTESNKCTGMSTNCH
jgi:hypothetical protein